MKKYFILVAILALVPFLSSCFTLNMNHNRRHIESIRAELHELHQDIDLVIFGLDPMPSE